MLSLQMDIKLRLCIRDSLLRLAQSAMQRKYAKDTSSTITIANDDLQYLATEEADDNKLVKQTIFLSINIRAYKKNCFDVLFFFFSIHLFHN